MPEHLTIAMLTFRRPDDLDEILPMLVDEAIMAQSDLLEVRVLVVDNSPEAGARAAVSDFGASSPVTVDYEHEPIAGIPSGRNRALAASAASDLLVFIDDDERPIRGWLTLLLQTRERYGAIAVVGSVVSEYAVPPSPWIVAGGFFDRRRMPTGTRLTVAATNNLLLDLRVVRRIGLEFDLALGLNGGDDTLFTRELATHGVMVWCDEAEVIDVVPERRITNEWVLRRAVRSGNSWAMSSIRLEKPGARRLGVRVRSIGDGLVRIAGGGARAIAGIIGGRMPWRARGVRTLARGAGMILGALGFSYLEYTRPEAPRRIEIARR